MARARRARIPAAARKTLLQWIDLDDGPTTVSSKPVCSADVQDLHTRIVVAESQGRHAERLEPPPGLRLAPLG